MLFVFINYYLKVISKLWFLFCFVCVIVYLKKLEERYTNEVQYIQYIQRHSVINHCDRRITHLGDLDISFVLLNISSKFLLHLECYLLWPKRHFKIHKKIKQTKRYINITKKNDTSITVIYHAMSLTVLLLSDVHYRWKIHKIINIKIFCFHTNNLKYKN